LHNNGPITLGSSDIEFTQFTGTGQIIDGYGIVNQAILYQLMLKRKVV